MSHDSIVHSPHSPQSPAHAARPRQGAPARWLALVTCLAGLLLGGCGGGGTGSVAPPTSPPAVAARAPVLEPASAVTATIGAGGGSVVATAQSGITYNLEIPAGALTGDVAITLTPILDMGSAPLAASVLGAVQMEPSGLRFQIPASLRIGTPATLLAGQQLTGFSTANDGSGFKFTLARVDGASTVVNITHFSTGGSATPTPAQLPPLAPLAPTLADADDAIAQLAELAARNAGLVQIVDVFRQWYVEIVKPALTQADGSTDIVFLIDAINAYKEWISAMDYIADQNSLALALSSEKSESAPIAKRVFKAFITRSLDDCANTTLTTESRLASLSLASTVQGIAQSVGLAGAGSGLDRAAFLLQVNNCLRVVIDPIKLPGGLAIGTGKSLDARALVIFSGQANPVAAPFRFTVSATGATLFTNGGNSDAAGRFTTVFTPTLASMQFTVKACLVIAGGLPSDICVQQTVSGNVGPLVKTYSGPVAFQQPASGTIFTGFLRVTIADTGAVNSIRVVESSGSFVRNDVGSTFCGPPPQVIVQLPFTDSTTTPMTGKFVVNGVSGQFEFAGRVRTSATNPVNTSISCETVVTVSDDPTLRTLAAFPFISVEMLNGAVQTIVLDKTLFNTDGSPGNIYTGRLELDP